MYISNISSIHVCINSFHWILLVIEIDRSWVTVWDSLKKPPEKYQNLIHIMQRAWSRFIKKHLGVTSTPTELEFNHNKPVRISHIYIHLFKQHEYFITCIYVYSVWDRIKEPTSADTTYVSTCTIFAEKPRGWHNKHSKYYNISNNFLHLIPCRY